MKNITLVICVLFSFTAIVECHISLEDIVRKEVVKLGKELESDDVTVKDSGCTCVYGKYDCGCCAHLEVETVGLNDTACVNVTYLPDQYGISLFMTWDGKVILNETVSARNPPPLCVGIPYVKVLDMCVAFYGLDVKNKTFHGCVKLEADVAHFEIEDVDLGCFDIPFSKKKSMANLSEVQLQMHKHAIKKLIDAMNTRRAVKLNNF